MATVTQPVPHPGATPATDAAWAKVRAMGDIQFTPLNPVRTPPQPTPAWMRALGDWLNKWVAPVGHWLGLHWRAFEWGALAVVTVGAAALIWSAWRGRQRQARAVAVADAAGWRPEAAVVTALLADADRLAEAGRFDEAVHLLLRRSFDDIAANRPDWLTPASTAREIAGLAALPAAARAAFAVIAREVERSRYALDPLGHPDWTRARAAYAAFAVPHRDAPA